VVNIERASIKTSDDKFGFVYQTYQLGAHALRTKKNRTRFVQPSTMDEVRSHVRNHGWMGLKSLYPLSDNLRQLRTRVSDVRLE
jgi:hypothetical protein